MMPILRSLRDADETLQAVARVEVCCLCTVIAQMRIVVMTDVHANLPALEAALREIRAEGYDAMFHTGDAIAIGPHPAECVELLRDTPDAHLIMGNHETYFVRGLPTPQPAWMSDGEVPHQTWTHARPDPNLRSILAEWPYVLEHEPECVRTVFLHYALAPSAEDFQPIMRSPSCLGAADHAVKEDYMARVSLNRTAPDFSLPDFSSKTVSLSEFRGRKNVLLVFNRGFY